MTTQAALSALAAMLLSLLFRFGPKVQPWFERLSTTSKRLFVLASIVVAAVLPFALSCTTALRPIATQFDLAPCTSAGVSEVLSAFIAALVASQSTYVLIQKPKGPGHYSDNPQW